MFIISFISLQKSLLILNMEKTTRKSMKSTKRTKSMRRHTSKMKRQPKRWQIVTWLMRLNTMIAKAPPIISMITKQERLNMNMMRMKWQRRPCKAHIVQPILNRKKLLLIN